MKAMVQDRYGLPDVLALQDIARPVPGEREVLLRVRATSLNPADWIFLTGQPYPVRAIAGWLRPRQRVIGLDVAGEVEAVGAAVTRFRPGDAVFGEIRGACAEYVCAGEDRLARMPTTLSFEQAAAVPVAAMPALQGLRDHARIRAGDRVLINGASGGVGTFAVQIARALGAEVTAVCSTRNVDLVRSLGAHRVIDYTREDFTRTPERHHAILDLVGSAPIAACLRVLRPGGVYVSSVGRTGWSLQAFLRSLLPGSRVVPLVARSTPDDLAALAALIEAGQVTPVIDRRYTLPEVPDALRRVGAGHLRGKLVVAV
jgi:NADPH:quinone reductase-like Zn-dependent oxidoreductase